MFWAFILFIASLSALRLALFLLLLPNIDETAPPTNPTPAPMAVPIPGAIAVPAAAPDAAPLSPELTAFVLGISYPLKSVAFERSSCLLPEVKSFSCIFGTFRLPEIVSYRPSAPWATPAILLSPIAGACAPCAACVGWAIFGVGAWLKLVAGAI